MQKLPFDIPDQDLLPYLKPTDRLYWLLVEIKLHLGIAKAKSAEFEKEYNKIVMEKMNVRQTD